MKILAIDPGYERIGIAIIERKAGVLDALPYSHCFKTSAKIAFNERLCAIGLEIERIIDLYNPQALAIEKLYLTTNQKTVMGVAEARGVIIYAASKHGLHICEYTPPQIKLAVTGYGKADKKMILTMIPKLIILPVSISSDDELDAIAIGLTCLASERFSTEGTLLPRK